MIDRMCGDFDRLPVALRKPWGFKDTVVLHSACGGFLHFMRLLREKVPATEFAKFEKTMTDQFMLGVLDPDILRALDATAPPSSLDAVGFLRPGCLPGSSVANELLDVWIMGFIRPFSCCCCKVMSVEFLHFLQECRG